MLANILYLLLGMAIMSFLNYIVSLGHSIHVIKKTQQSCAALFAVSEQGVQEILQLKYIAMEEAKRSEQSIRAQKYIDQINLSSVKKSIMRNYIETFPEKYSHLIQYSTWDELDDYINNIARKSKETR